MPERKELATLVQDGVNPETFAIRSQEARWLREAIQKLPAQYRIVLVLRDMEGLTDEEVAEITGLRAGTVRVRLHRARLFVRKEVVKQERGRSRQVRQVISHVMTTGAPRLRHCKAMFAELSNYLDEQLDDSMCDELEKHLGGCEPCQVFLSSLEATIAQCRKSPAECPNGKKAAQMRKEILKNYNRVAALRA